MTAVWLFADCARMAANARRLSAVLHRTVRSHRFADAAGLPHVIGGQEGSEDVTGCFRVVVVVLFWRPPRGEVSGFIMVRLGR
ncbi:MAG: hypothetical protein B7Y28_14865 [Polaromonas sp. 16-63-31]|nr:MAG: hypothetical protein B7Y28_14865 [Polaromonas sp. 16-63-31]